jgi:hypothetical protein
VPDTTRVEQVTCSQAMITAIMCAVSYYFDKYLAFLLAVSVLTPASSAS